MNTQRLTALSRNRYIVLTITAGVTAAISAILFIGAPPIPAALGIGLAVSWLVWRAPAE